MVSVFQYAQAGVEQVQVYLQKAGLCVPEIVLGVQIPLDVVIRAGEEMQLVLIQDQCIFLVLSKAAIPAEAPVAVLVQELAPLTARQHVLVTDALLAHHVDHVLVCVQTPAQAVVLHLATVARVVVLSVSPVADMGVLTPA